MRVPPPELERRLFAYTPAKKVNYRLVIFTSAVMFCNLACGEKPLPQVKLGAQSAAMASVNKKTEQSTITQPYDVQCTENPPGDNTAGFNKLACTKRDQMGAEEASKVDRIYEEFAWQTFIWVNQYHRGQRRWNEWKPQSVVTNPQCAQNGGENMVAGTNTSTAIDDTHQPSPRQNPLWDRNGNPISFDVRVYNPDDTKREQFYKMMSSIPAQVNSTCNSDIIARAGKNPNSSLGQEDGYPATVRLKLAWKVLSPAEQTKSNHFIVDDDHNPSHGLVAMHIAVKSDTTSGWWTWATFSHISNLKEKNGLGPLFQVCANEATCPEANKCPQCSDGESCPTTIKRIHPISNDVAQLNNTQQDKLRSPLRYYELVGMQRIREAWPGTAYNREEGQVIFPEFLASEVIEWDVQEHSTCMGCHLSVSSWAYKEMEYCDHGCTCESVFRDGQDIKCKLACQDTTGLASNQDDISFESTTVELRRFSPTQEFNSVDMFAMLSRALPDSDEGIASTTTVTETTGQPGLQ